MAPSNSDDYQSADECQHNECLADVRLAGDVSVAHLQMECFLFTARFERYRRHGDDHVVKRVEQIDLLTVAEVAEEITRVLGQMYGTCRGEQQGGELRR